MTTPKQKSIKVEHTTFRNGNLFCLNCGGEFKMVLRMPSDQLSPKIEAFNNLHADCLPTWREPEADQAIDVMERAVWWVTNGETGSSSKTMWAVFMGQPLGRHDINHPYDPDDFSRCYKLLNTVPEWKKEMQRLKPLSKQWSNLVDNWDKLTEMYEENVRTHWKNYDQIGMYEFMKTLIK